MRSISRRHHLLVLVVLGWSGTVRPAVAQPREPSPPHSTPQAAVAQVPRGDVIRVTDRAGRTIKGALVSATDEAIEVRSGNEIGRTRLDDVQRIQWQQRDSILTGALIGAGIGAVPGLYWLVADPNECTGMCPEEYGMIAAGAIVGALIDRALTRKVTIYRASPSTRRPGRVDVRPMVTSSHRAIQVVLTF